LRGRAPDPGWRDGAAECKYRGIKRTTDVLSFPDEEKREPELHGDPKRRHRRAFLGDIAISPVVARRNARALGRKLPEELQS